MKLKVRILALCLLAVLISSLSAQVLGDHTRAQCVPGPAAPRLYDPATPGVYYDCSAPNVYSASGTYLVWGAITGTLADQLDLAAALALLAPKTNPDFIGALTATVSISTVKYKTNTNCSSAAAPAVCAAAASGSVVVAAAGTSVVVNTTAVTANSQILVTFDASLGTKLSVTCNATIPTLYGVSARTAGTSFTLSSTAPTTDPACFSYSIVN